MSKIRSKIAGIQQKYGHSGAEHPKLSESVLEVDGSTYNYVQKPQPHVLSNTCDDQLKSPVTPCYTIKHSFDNSVKESIDSSIGNCVFPYNRGNKVEQDVWESWFAKRHNCEMGDAFEPQAEDMLDMVGFDLQPAEIIPAEQVLAAADHLRSMGDRKSTIAMMNSANIWDFVWSVDPITNHWGCHAAF